MHVRNYCADHDLHGDSHVTSFEPNMTRCSWQAYQIATCGISGVQYRLLVAAPIKQAPCLLRWRWSAPDTAELVEHVSSM